MTLSEAIYHRLPKHENLGNRSKQKNDRETGCH